MILGKGAVIGFSIAAPVGPVGVLCIRRSMVWGGSYGFASGLGAAVADALYGVLAAGGFSLVARALVEQQTALSFAGAILMAYLGYRLLRRHPGPGNVDLREERPSRWHAFASTLALTLANPITVVAFAGLMAGLKLGVGGWGEGVWFVFGVFLGSSLWWLGLSQAASRLGQRWEGLDLRWLDLISGGVLLGFAGLALAKALGLVG